MPNDNVKASVVISWLQHIGGVKLIIDKDQEAIALMEQRLDLSGISYDGVGGGTSSDVGDKIAELVDLKCELTIKHAMDNLEYAQAYAICHTGDVSRLMLWCHYVERHTWYKVGDVCGYSHKYAQRKAFAGISSLYDAMPEEYREIPEAI